MKYENITEGRFLDRPNRFIAHVEIAGQTETVHVKNTGCQLRTRRVSADVVTPPSESDTSVS